jgi:glycosyltransferase involved in cell wall biosynthesis
MHVLMLCALEVWALPGAGGAPSLARTLRAYSDRGHRVTFAGARIGANAYLPGGRLRDAVAQEPPKIPNVTFELFDLPSLQRAPVPLPSMLRTLDQKLRFALVFPRLAARRASAVMGRDRPDVLYAYEVHGALAARQLGERWGGPTVARFQGTVLHPTLNDRLARARKYEEVQAIRTPADLYIMTDDGTRGDEVMATLNPASSGKVRFWRNGLEMDRLHPATPEQRREQRERDGIEPDAFVLVTASRLVAWKRVDRAIDALALARQSVPGAMLLVVGDGHERIALEQHARDRGVADAVRFVGSVAQESVADYMRAADVFLAVADLSNVGNPLLEAMACGLAIVAVDAGDTRDLIVDGKTGRLVASGDPAAIARAIEDLSADTEARARLASAARAYAEEHFWTWEQRMDAEVSEVERLAGAARSGATPSIDG